MADRRRSPRFTFHAPPKAWMRAASDVVVESCNDDGVVAIANHGALRDEVLILRLTRTTGEVETAAFRVLSSAPIDAEPRQFRLVLARHDGLAEWPFDALAVP